jgi:hypothetical protein
MFSPRRSTSSTSNTACTQQQSPTPTNADDPSTRRSTRSTSTPATSSSGHLRQPTPMLSPRGDAPVRRAPLLATSSSNLRQPTPNAATSSRRRSTSSTSNTVSLSAPSSSNLRPPAPMLPPRGEASARRAPLQPAAAVTIANQRRCLVPEEKHQLDEQHCVHHQQ